MKQRGVTGRQLEIAGLMASGLSQVEISTKLGVTRVAIWKIVKVLKRHAKARSDEEIITWYRAREAAERAAIYPQPPEPSQ